MLISSLLKVEINILHTFSRYVLPIKYLLLTLHRYLNSTYELQNQETNLRLCWSDDCLYTLVESDRKQGFY